MATTGVRPLGAAALLAVVGSTAAPCQSVTGTIQDSLLGRGRLANATLWIQDTATGVQTDGAGRFRIEGAPAGTYTISFSHPSYDSAGISPPSWRITVPPGGLKKLTLATPSPRAVFGAACPGETAADIGYVVGRVRDAVADTGLTGVGITASWLAPAKGKGKGAAVLVRNQTRTGNGGAFVLCPVPKRSVFAVQAAADSLTTGIITYSLNGGPIAVLALRLATRPAAGADGAIPLSAARLRGTVLALDGQPVADARVWVDEATVATTDASGEFMLAELPLGTHVVYVGAIGREPASRVVDLRPGDNGPIELETGGAVQRLASLEVMGPSASMISMSAIEDRVRRASGQLITARDIENRRSRKFEDVLRGVPGLSVGPAPTTGDRAVSSRGQRDFRARACAPTYFLDGAMTDGPLDQASFPVQVEDIRAIEVYTGANMPVEYHREGGLCGAIAVWTKRRIEEGTR